jgi:bile acid:Na+ symporter, BASS family
MARGAVDRGGFAGRAAEGSMWNNLGLALPPIVFLFTVGLGLGLTVDDFKRLFQRPKAVLVALSGHLLLLPAIGISVAWLFRDNPVIALGLVLLAAAPAGPLSNSMVFVARGRVELSITLTAINSALALLTMPLITSAGFQLIAGETARIRLPIVPTIAQIFAVTLVPLGIGMFVRWKWANWAVRNEKRVRSAIGVLMVLTILIVFVISWNVLVQNLADLALAGLTFCAALIVVVLLYTAAFGLDTATRFTIVVEVVIQNVVLTAMVATTILHKPELAIFAAAYAPAIALAMLAWVFARKWRVERAGFAAVTDDGGLGQDRHAAVR